MSTRKHKKTHSHKLTTRYIRRDAVAVARRSDYRESHSLPGLIPRTVLPRLSLIQDNRIFSPDSNYFVPRSIEGNPVRIGVPQVSRPVKKRMASGNPFKFLSPRVMIQDANKAVVCLSRKRRKEVIHALGVAGTRTARPRISRNSSIHCK